MTRSKIRSNSNRSGTNEHRTEHLGDRLFQALTTQEVGQLLEALFEVLEPEQIFSAIQTLESDTQTTIEQILAPHPPEIPASAPQPLSTSPPASFAKQLETWNHLWSDWQRCIDEATGDYETGSRYLIYEEAWEPPYLDTDRLSHDLEAIAQEIYPLIPLIFNYGEKASNKFTTKFLEAEASILNDSSDWIVDSVDSLLIGEHGTRCLLLWEWFCHAEKQQDAFQFIQSLVKIDQRFSIITLDDDAFIDFVLDYPDIDQRAIFDGFKAHHHESFWETHLNRVSSKWYIIAQELNRKFDPKQYQHQLRKTIPQRWQNSLPVLENLIAHAQYKTALEVVHEAIAALPKAYQFKETDWHPEINIFYAVFDQERLHDSEGEELLRYYSQIAQAMKQADLSKALDLQWLSISHGTDWEVMLKAFENSSLPESTHKALFASWREYAIRDSCRLWMMSNQSLNWWPAWLLDTLVAGQHGRSHFQDQVFIWLESLSEMETIPKDQRIALQWLTQDLRPIDETTPPYPHFFEVVIKRVFFDPKRLNTSRQRYLHQIAPDDLWDEVMATWSTVLPRLIPNPKNARSSRYEDHANWMKALHEISPSAYKVILANWQVEHKRRSNLWKAMRSAKLPLA